jgi:hypothetical protein
VSYIQGLPVHPDPEVFGMHENASLTFQRQVRPPHCALRCGWAACAEWTRRPRARAQETDKILTTIISIQPQEIAAGDHAARTRCRACLARLTERACRRSGR